MFIRSVLLYVNVQRSKLEISKEREKGDEEDLLSRDFGNLPRLGTPGFRATVSMSPLSDYVHTSVRTP